MKARVVPYSHRGMQGFTIYGFTIQTRKVWWPFWKQFLYSVHEGGGQYCIFEQTKVKALLKYKKECKKYTGFIKS